MGLSRQIFPDVVIMAGISPMQQGVGIVAFVLTSFVLAVWLSRPTSALST